jgi:two-component system, cell cycle sensor histidine kinase and response regulator CckA
MIQAESRAAETGGNCMAPETSDPALPPPVVNQEARPGEVMRLLSLGLVLMAVAALFFLFGDRLGEQFRLGLLGIFAMVGVFYLFASVIGIIRIAPRSTGNEMARSLLDGAGEGAVVSDERGRIVYANKAYADICGMGSPDTVRSLESVLNGVPEANDALERLNAALGAGLSAVEEFRISHSLSGNRSGLASWYRVRARPLKLADTGQQLSVWQISDISGERSEQERFFRDLQLAIDHLDHAPAGFMATNADGTVAYINATLADWIGIDLGTFRPGTMDMSDLIAGDGTAIIASVKAEPGMTRSAVIDLDMAKLNGQALPVRFHHRVQTSKDGHTTTSRTIIINRSGSEDGLSEQRQAEVRFTRFFNSAPMAIAALDKDGKVLRTNGPFHRLFSGLFDHDVVDQHLALESAVHERDRAAFRQALSAAVARQADISPIDTVMSNDENRNLRFYFNTNADESIEDGGEAAFVYAIETTEQKAFEAQIAQSQKMQAVGQLAGGIAHDFNNVLTAIIMSSDLLLTNHRASDPSFPDIMNIKQNANRAASLVRQLLAYSRRQTLRPQVISLMDVLADLRMLLTRLVGPDVSLKIEHGRDLWPVRADVGQFEQVIVNLVVNARDAMPGGGTVNIRTRNLDASEVTGFGYRELIEGDYVLTQVSDVGTGIPAAIREKIFEPFFTTKEVGKGTGLGLSMVYGIVKQTGGFIYVDSEEGKGSTFNIFLPRHIAQVASDNGASSGEDSASNGFTPEVQPAKQSSSADLSGNAIVLMVEDEDSVRMGGIRALQSRGYTVHEAASGVEALEVMESLDGKVDIIVSDVVMPEMDGPTLLRELRIKYGDVKFIFVSGYAEDAFAKNLPPDAKFGFLPKPYSLKQLAAAVKEKLEEA